MKNQRPTKDIVINLIGWADVCVQKENITLLNDAVDRIQTLQSKVISQSRIISQFEKAQEIIQAENLKLTKEIEDLTKTE